MNGKTNPAPGPGPAPAGRVWTFIRIMNVRLRFIFLMVLVGLVAGYWENITNYYDRWRRPVEVLTGAHAEETEYYCPMHPSVVRDRPGNCPICGMPLSKRPKSGERQLPEGVLAQVQLSPLKVEMGRIGTSPVEYRLLARDIRTVGIVDYDETRRAFIAARIKGRIDKLNVNYTGQHVEKGDPLVWIYSPDLLVAQEELLGAVRSQKQQKNGGDWAASAAQSLVESSRRKLSLWGITDQQIDEIIQRGTPETHLTIYSSMAGIVTERKVLEGKYVMEGDDLYTIADLSTVWMQAKIFENDIAGVEIGTVVEVTSTAYPNEVFAGRITFIAYTVDPGTRTVSARVEVANPEYKLKPGMYARARIGLPMGQVTPVDTASQATASSRGATVNTAGLVEPYLALAAAYAADKTSDSAASQLAREAEALAEKSAEGGHTQVAPIAELAKQLAGKDLKAQREIFKSLSGKVINFLGQHPPTDKKLFVVHCPMAKADWLAAAEEVINPYYGSAMLNCGSVTGPLKAKSAGAEDDERFAHGYFCPIYPDRLFDEPAECPVDKFPLKYVKAEKVLAVPESAVINTGVRRIVYRESAPGTFDMVEVRVGPKAGEFYPVLSGLAPGDRVATAGAFLVDAENRLNPAASAQYFGASGGPQSSGHQHGQ
jgi:Cu(I)/Ag(I) efflux system membrane fusion protein